MIVNTMANIFIEDEDTNPTHKVDLYLNFCFPGKKYHHVGRNRDKILDY
ncbi:hypothetical protein Niako_7040 [Niastella koreensis GR20-10]|uniref:Uncharacterized protein n=1 Tax=Niastella koreensis (strain DSM 17620 / KACC 11465 / NBRC 106392 / GR20-10) TaxID=700598 RepID=G8TQL4_NIAKG|nr:hypothetical protein Niako_7040 [Niastella koreensis GR20-10]